MTEYTRTLYAACPICESTERKIIGFYNCTHHPLWRPGLPATINWQSCDKCGHIFTDGYFSGDAADFLFAKGQPDQFPFVAEDSRYVASLLIDRVAAPREPFSDPSPRWLDVGFGAGALLMTAAEYGYDVTGLDLRKENVEALDKLGYKAFGIPIEVHAAGDMRPDDIALAQGGPYSVISMMNVLEHMPFPKTALDSAYKLLNPDGALVVSCPNMDTAIWRDWDARNSNPYWSEIEHYHNFTRKSLSALLEAHGFSPVSYHVSPRYRSGMEIIAMKKEAPF